MFKLLLPRGRHNFEGLIWICSGVVGKMPVRTTGKRVGDLARSAVQIMDQASKKTHEKAIITQLCTATRELSERGLLHSAKWASEMLASYHHSNPDIFDQEDFLTGPEKVDPIFTLAKTYFDLKEYHRSAHVLQKSTDIKSFFLRNYSLFLAGEKTKTEERLEVGDQYPVKNRLLVKIKEELEKLEAMDGYGYYLYDPKFLGLSFSIGAFQFTKLFANLRRYGIILREMAGPSAIQRARNAFVKSVSLAPCNWSAWQDLASLCPDRDVLRQLHLDTEHWVYPFFEAHLYLELQLNEESERSYEKIQENYPSSDYLLAQKAVVSYNLQDYEKSQQLFETLAARDPYRITNMDIYSNILYITQKQTKLGFLAYRVTSTDKYTPETNAIIGNYYSAKSDHQNAIKYFQRALTLNPKYLSAWILMGHEYIELKNEKAAIPAYRKAVDINPRDFRAWYGLGLSYELGGLPLYALYYYGKACALRPYDTTMWCALAECFAHENIGHIQESIKCFERALAHDKEGIAFFKLAQLYKKFLDKGKDWKDRAAYYFKKFIDFKEQWDFPPDEDQAEALSYLAHSCYEEARYGDAVRYCNKLLFYATRQEEAKSLLREIHQNVKESD